MLAFAKAQISEQVNNTYTATANHRSEMPNKLQLTVLSKIFNDPRTSTISYPNLKSMVVLKTRSQDRWTPTINKTEIQNLPRKKLMPIGWLILPSQFPKLSRSMQKAHTRDASVHCSSISHRRCLPTKHAMHDNNTWPYFDFGFGLQRATDITDVDSRSRWAT